MTETADQDRVQRQWRFWMNDCEAVLGITIVLIVIGSLNVFSSSFVIAGTNYDDPYFFCRKQGMNVAVGVVCFILGSLIDYHLLIKARTVGFWAVAAMLAVVFLVGIEVNGAQRWLSLGSMQIQPAEFAKPCAIFLEANYIASRIQYGMRCNVFHRELGFIGILFAMVEQEPDMGTALIIGGIPLLMLFCSNLKNITRFKIVSGVLLLAAALCILQPYRLMRVMTMLNPWADAQGAGYQSVQSLQAIGSGGLLGMGLGMGVSKYHYLPEAHTDFAFSVWCQETGFIGAFFVLLMFALLAYYGIKIANNAKDALGQLLAFGMTMMITVQALINLLMISGCMPVVGVPLPFISYGGTSLFVTMFVVGIVFNVGYRSQTDEDAAETADEETQAAPAPRVRLRRVK